jgi:putative endonuclease
VALLSRFVFGLVNFAARKGLVELEAPSEAAGKLRARQTGVRGETYAYWYLRRHGYILVARNYTAAGIKGEIDLVGYDGSVLVFIEVKTRAANGEAPGRAEEAVTPDKRRHLARMARRFLAERRIAEAVCRFDVLAIDNRPGAAPLVRLHKDAFSARG